MEKANYTRVGSYLSDPFLRDHKNLICRIIGPLQQTNISNDPNILLNSVANNHLNKNEMEHWITLPQVNPRKHEWLVGRLVAKEIVKEWCLEKYNLIINLNEIEIDKDDFGKPFISCIKIESLGPLPQISISHSGGTSVAALHKEGKALGIDYEDITKRSIGSWLKRAFTEQELQLAKNCDETFLLALWTAKEAASKALGTGLQGRWREWLIKNISPDQKQVIVLHKGNNYPTQLFQNKNQIIAICEQ